MDNLETIEEKHERINIPLLRKVVEHIEANPDHFYMEEWMINVNEHMAKKFLQMYGRELSCGTACCIAGWVDKLVEDKECDTKFLGIDDRAEKLLGITSEEADQLFYGRDWNNPANNYGIFYLNEHPEMVRPYVETFFGIRL